MIFKEVLYCFLFLLALLKNGDAMDDYRNNFVSPSTVSSLNGLLKTTMAMEQATHKFSNSSLQLTTRLLNGTYPGPTVRIKPGDRLQLKFRNSLKSQGVSFVHNQLSAPDETNLHFHGLHIDNQPSHKAVRPKESRNYLIDIPEYHMPGTHWIHPHRHGSAALQVGGGAFLALIVEDPPNTLPSQVEDATEILFLAHLIDIEELQQIASLSEDNLLTFSNSTEENKFVTVNGQMKPTISINAGEWIRLRVIWAGWFEGNLDLTIPGCEMNLLAKDGVYIQDFPRTIQTAPIVPGGRADIMFRCNNASSSYPIYGMTGKLATLITSDDDAISSEELESWTPSYPEYLVDLRSQAASPGCSCETVLHDNAVNGYPFMMDHVLHTSYLGAIVDRKLVSGEHRHPYHQHTYPFQLESGFEISVGDDEGYNLMGDWHDTFIGDGIIRYSPTDFAGDLMFHCHRLDHSDHGMMGSEEVKANGTCTCTDSIASLSSTVVLPRSTFLIIGILDIVIVVSLFVVLFIHYYKKTVETSRKQGPLRGLRPFSTASKS